MENQEMNVFEEVTETVEVANTSNSGLGWKIAAGVIAVAGLAYGGYKIISKKKAKKRAEKVDAIPTTCSDKDEEITEED